MSQFPHAKIPEQFQEDDEVSNFMEDLRLLVKDIHLIGENLGIRVGTGSPEGVILARPGTLFLRKDGPPTLYVKETGTAANGWVAK